MSLSKYALICVCLAGCQSPMETVPTNSVEPGAYRGDHGNITGKIGLESEFVLNSDGTFRYLLIENNTAFQTSKGKWNAKENEIYLHEVFRSSLYHGGFRFWDTVLTPDTSYLRNVTDSSFERMEATYDTLYVPIARWVRYSKMQATPPLHAGTFEFRESFVNGVDSTLMDSGLTQINISPTRIYHQEVRINGNDYMTDTDSSMIQLGSFLITSNNTHCEFEPGYSHCSDAPLEYEYIARIKQAESNGFQLWMAPGYSFQPEPFWASFVRKP